MVPVAGTPSCRSTRTRDQREENYSSSVHGDCRRQLRRHSSDARGRWPAAGSTTPLPCRPHRRRSPASPLPHCCPASSARGRQRASAPPPCSICLGHQECHAQALYLAGRPSSAPAVASIASAAQRVPKVFGV